MLTTLVRLAGAGAGIVLAHPGRGDRILALQHARAQSQGVEPMNAIHMTASKLFFTIRYEDGIAKAESRPTHICIKGEFNPDQLAAYPFLARIYQRGSAFFSKSAPKLRMNLPKVWWADHGVVVMDDLAYKECKFAVPLQTWPGERVLLIIEQLASLHAGTRGMSRRTILGAHRTMGSSHWASQKRADTAVEKYYKSGNLKRPPNFVDFRIMYISSAFRDLAYFVDSALSVEDRRGHENDIIDHYFKSLAEFGRPIMERDDEAEYAHSFMSSFSWVGAPYSMQTKE
ncbi:hypothetical protein DL764_010077 [Monosporascus ibericus]|uniref:Uncharacterized protein n=1 Tax=Monosporascus ibericus TaxID=155417 RepID=A0A4Q4STE1_9PEZI|nr:hypothetical protein DL764_010077 [Monosporascus ibericus]